MPDLQIQVKRVELLPKNNSACHRENLNDLESDL